MSTRYLHTMLRSSDIERTRPFLEALGYEFSRDIFERQQRVNHILFACVQELATEIARLRREVQALSQTTR